MTGQGICTVTINEFKRADTLSPWKVRKLSSVTYHDVYEGQFTSHTHNLMTDESGDNVIMFIEIWASFDKYANTED